MCVYVCVRERVCVCVYVVCVCVCLFVYLSSKKKTCTEKRDPHLVERLGPLVQAAQDVDEALEPLHLQFEEKRKEIRFLVCCVLKRMRAMKASPSCCALAAEAAGCPCPSSDDLGQPLGEQKFMNDVCVCVCVCMCMCVCVSHRVTETHNSTQFQLTWTNH